MKTKNLLLITLLIALQNNVKCDTNVANCTGNDNLFVVDCTKHADHTLLVDPASCTNYYKCLHGIPMRKSCRVGYYFDDVNFQCNYAALVDCTRSRSKSIPTTLDIQTGQLKNAVDVSTPCPVPCPVTCLCIHHYPQPWIYPSPSIAAPCPGPNPAPNPAPCPGPNPAPNPAPCPGPNPAPNPAPCPGPNPAPCPGPNPAPCPGPNPAPCPEPNPEPCPGPNPAPCPGPTPAPCPNTVDCTCPTTTAKPSEALFEAHPISKRLYYEIKSGVKRLRKCKKNQVFDLSTTSCKITT